MTIGAVLAPLAERYGSWLSLDAEQVVADRQEAAADVRAMQLVLRIERAEPPRWSDALAAACSAATAVCLDPRAGQGGEWHAAVASYIDVHIRKVVRRARAGEWRAVQDLPGVTVETGSAEVRALVPGPLGEIDRRVSKLQVGGTDLTVDLTARPPEPPPTGVLGLLVGEDLPVTAGKLAAQTGHAGMIAAALLAGSAPGRLESWAHAGFPAAVQRLSTADWFRLVERAGAAAGWQQRLIAVRDAGFTEIPPGTITVVADASTV